MVTLLLVILSPFEPLELPEPRRPLTLAEVIDRGLVMPDPTWSEGEITRHFEHFCRAGDPTACLLASPPPDAEGLQVLCREGDPDACTALVWWVGRHPPLREALLDLGCHLGGAPACLAAARLRAAQGRGAVALSLAEAACRQGAGSGCLVRADLEPDPRVRQAQLSALCTDGDARGCLRWWVAQRDDPVARAQAAVRACGLGVRALCAPGLAAWQAAGGAPTARVAAQVRRRGCALGIEALCEATCR